MTSYRAQGSSEYLVLLAVVLIVALVAVALLGGFSSFGTDARTSQNSQYWSATRPFAVLGYTQKGTTMTINLRNQEADRLIITNLSLSPPINGSYVSNATVIIYNGGQAKNIEVNGLRACDPITYDSFEYVLTIAYTTPDISNRFVGVKNLVGLCTP